MSSIGMVIAALRSDPTHDAVLREGDCIAAALLPRFGLTRKAERQFLIFPRGSFLAVTPEVHSLDIVGMVVSPRPAHSSRINVVGHDVVIVGGRQLTDGALPVVFDNLAVEQLSHFCFGAELAVSSRMVRVFDRLHSELSDSGSPLNRFPFDPLHDSAVP